MQAAYSLPIVYHWDDASHGDMSQGHTNISPRTLSLFFLDTCLWSSCGDLVQRVVVVFIASCFCYLGLEIWSSNNGIYITPTASNVELILVMGQLIQSRELHSFTFISDELVLATFTDEEQVSLRVLAVTRGISIPSEKDVQYLCELRFPMLRAMAEGISISSEPSPTSTTPNNTAPFTHSSTDVLFTVTLKYSMGRNPSSFIVLLVPRSTILHHILCVSTSSQKHLKWESWGPKGSRMLDIEPSNVWVCHSYGMKFVHSPCRNFANVYDLNPYATRKDVNSANRPDFPWGIMEKETKISGRHNPFDTDVVTSLPGREASIELIPNEHGWEATMIAEDHIVLVQVSKSTINTISPLMTLVSRNIPL